MKRETYKNARIFRLAQKKARLTRAIALLNRIQIDALGNSENEFLVDSISAVLVELKDYKSRLAKI